MKERNQYISTKYLRCSLKRGQQQSLIPHSMICNISPQLNLTGFLSITLLISHYSFITKTCIHIQDIYTGYIFLVKIYFQVVFTTLWDNWRHHRDEGTREKIRFLFLALPCTFCALLNEFSDLDFLTPYWKTGSHYSIMLLLIYFLGVPPGFIELKKYKRP